MGVVVAWLLLLLLAGTEPAQLRLTPSSSLTNSRKLRVLNTLGTVTTTMLPAGIKQFWQRVLRPPRQAPSRAPAPAPDRSPPQVLMTECPLNSQCVSRNFCDEAGLVTQLPSNTLNFQSDKRGLLVSVTVLSSFPFSRC